MGSGAEIIHARTVFRNRNLAFPGIGAVPPPQESIDSGVNFPFLVTGAQSAFPGRISMIQGNYFEDNEDLQLHLEEITDWEELVEAYEGDFLDAKEYQKSGDEKLSLAPGNVKEAVDYYRTIVQSSGDLAGTILSQASQAMDHEGLKYNDGQVTFPQPMVEAFEAVKEAGIMPYATNRRYGGLGIPLSVQTMMMELTSRADASFAIAMGCVNLAETIEKFGSKEMIEKYVPQMSRGDLVGAMALTEPNYGSDLPNVQTRAEQDENGNWKINGTKRFITHACGFDKYPSVILTLARTGKPGSGARGLSFFLVEGKDVHVAKIEHKMGLHCSPTCEVVYEDSPAQLIGETGQGLVKYAMEMMNTARLSIAGQSMGIAEAAYREAKKYASEREQFGKLIQEIPAVKKMLDRMEREVVAMRALLQEAARTVDKYLWRKERLLHDGMSDRDVRKDETVRSWEKLANFFTPLTKYYISETCNELAFDALQIHGGSGYTEEYDVARIYRDARITNIYEGTTQLQVVAAIGGIVSGMTPNGNLRAYIDEEMAKFQPSAELLEVQKSFEEVVQLYKGVKGNLRDENAFEVVQSAARFIMGLLVERSNARVNAEAAAHRSNLVHAFNLESKALLQANIIRIRGAAEVAETLQEREPAAV